jgi:DNA-binding transcriptional LysR family regulator
MPSLRQIRYFISVADTGSFTQAANRCFVAQPALSRQMAQLEDELGFALFVREARGVQLTPAGALFLERARGLEQGLEVAADDARRLARGEAGVLRLVHSSSLPVAGALLVTLEQFVREAPGVRVDLDRLSSEQQMRELAEGRADLGLARMPVLRRDPELEVQPLAPEPLWVALPAEHPLAARAGLWVADLAEVALVSAVHRERGGLARRVADLCLSRGFVPRLAPVISRKTSMLTLVGAGFGGAVIPAGMRALVPGGVVLRPLLDEDAWAEVALVLPPRPSVLALGFAERLRAGWGGDALSDAS